jgi:hypothetical protein
MLLKHSPVTWSMLLETNKLTRGTHERLGDAILAAQEAYAQTGLLPELLSTYHLFGDPALRLR